MPTQVSRPSAKLSSRARLLLQVARGICLFLPLFLLASPAAISQAKRPRILGFGQVTITGDSCDAISPFGFYSELNFGSLYQFQSGAHCVSSYGLNERQELVLSVGPRLPLRPDKPPRNNLASVLFEASDVVALHDFLQSKRLTVGPVTASAAIVKDAAGKEITGTPSYFTMQDPELHEIGFIQFKTPLEAHVQGKPISAHLLHAGWVVKDRAAMDKFYKDILGFRLYWQGGMKDNETDWVSMQVPDGTDWIEYMLNVPESADKHLLGIMNHIALGVSDVREAARQLEAKGMRLPEPPKIGRDGKWQLNLYDPDGTRVEFMEFAPVEKPCCSEYTGSHPKP